MSIYLYIRGQQADLPDGVAIQYTYQEADADAPAAEKNEFTQSVSLTSSPANDAIFSMFFRLDQRTAGGFDPNAREPFLLTDGGNIVLERGYIKLDSVKRNGAAVTYNITMYGGLGSFIYDLSFDTAGNKRTLADIDYLSTGDSQHELDFVVNRSSVAAAWQRIAGDTSTSALWDTLNFAPAYNGIPSKNFSADKALANCEDCSLETQHSDGTKTYYAQSGKALVSLADERTEWALRDLRSYLQRPVLRVKSLIDAIAQPANNGGHSVTLDTTFFNADNPYYSKTWLTLPLLNDIDIAQEVTETTINVIPTIYPGAEDGVIITLLPERPIGTTTNIAVNIVPRMTLPQNIPASTNYFNLGSEAASEPPYRGAIAIQLMAYNAAGQMVSTSKVSFFQSFVTESDSPTLPNSFWLTRFEPIGQFDLMPDACVGYFGRDGRWLGDTMTMTMSDLPDVHAVRIRMTYVYMLDYPAIYNERLFVFAYDSADNLLSRLDDNRFTGAPSASGENTATQTTSAAVRSGATITKANLLTTNKTPADYLLAYCKMFGLRIICDRTSGNISIVSRDTYYNGGIKTLEDIDLTAMTLQPNGAASRWYTFTEPTEKGEFAQYYANVFGGRYGQTRHDTGRDFDASETEVFDKALNGLAEVSQRSKYNYDISNPAFPAVFLDGGQTYQLIANDGSAIELPCPIVNRASTITPWNASFAGYDLFSKPQIHDSEDKAFEHRDALLFFRGMHTDTAERFHLSDDSIWMSALNDGNPCWLLGDEHDEATAAGSIPMFGRHLYNGNALTYSLDMSLPKVLDIPGISADESKAVFAKRWKIFFADRYGRDAKVITLPVYWGGRQVDGRLLRSFYAFGGAIWALRKISNYNIVTGAPCSCEFVRVGDMQHYTNGQSI